MGNLLPTFKWRATVLPSGAQAPPDANFQADAGRAAYDIGDGHDLPDVERLSESYASYSRLNSSSPGTSERSEVEDCRPQEQRPRRLVNKTQHERLREFVRRANRQGTPRGFAFPKAAFDRLIEETMLEVVGDPDTTGARRWTPEARLRLQEVAEEYIKQLFADMDLCAQHAGRQTVRVTDLELVQRLRRSVPQ